MIKKVLEHKACVKVTKVVIANKALKGASLR
jgi:hypothetical protein